jgi:hypothetical protein
MDRLREVPPKIGEKFSKVVEQYATLAYTEIAKEHGDSFSGNPENIFYHGACQQFSQIMYKKLTNLGIKSEYKSVDIKSVVPNSPHHMYIVSGDYIIDGTWQQFLDTPRDENKCLILNKKSLEADLQKMNVPRHLWFIYGVQEDRQAIAA